MCCKATKRQVSKKHRTQSSTHLPRRDIALVDAKYPSAKYWSGSMHRSSKRTYVRKSVHDVDSQTLLRILLHALYCPVFCQTLPSTEGGELLYCTYYTILYLVLTLLHYAILRFATLLGYSLKILVLYCPIFLNYSTLKSLYVSTFCGGTEKSWAPVRNSTMFYHTVLLPA